MQNPATPLELSTPPEEITETEILAFARDFDPQPYHLDPAAAAESIFGALCASGWQICSFMTTRVLSAAGAAGHRFEQRAVRDLRFRKPVFPGDRLAVLASIDAEPGGGHRASTRVVREDGTEVLTATLLLAEGTP